MTEPGEILKDEARSAWENVLDGAVWRAEKYRAALEKIREIEDMADAPCANRESKSCGTTCVCSLLVAEKALVQPFAHGGILPPGPPVLVGEQIPVSLELRDSFCPGCGCDRNSAMAKALTVEVLKAAGGVTNEMVDPGGRLIVVGGITIRLGDQCDVCDLRTILDREA